MSDESTFSEFPTLPVSAGGSGPARELDAPSAGQGSIGPYRIISHLGDGGFGSVYLAEQTHPVRRRVAIKVLKSGMNTPSLVARFEAERQLLVMMDHPGVAKVFDAGVTAEGRPYVVMEYVAGEPISRFCEHQNLSVDDRVRLMVKVCNAVHHAHMKGVIHRDLKPANILVEMVDDKPSPRVIDFGVAKALDRSLSESSVLTEFGQMVGTPEYMPPEQARGSGRGGGDVDTRADVYSLGAVLYELLTGVTPLDSTSLRRAGYAELQRMIEQQAPVLPSERLTGIRSRGATMEGDGGVGTATRVARVSRELDWIVMRCLEKDRARRYESAAALARDLERHLNNEPVEAGPPSMSYRAAKFVQRNKVAVGAGVLCVVMGATALGVTGWALKRAIEDRKLAEGEEKKAIAARDEAEAVTAFLTGMLGSVDPAQSGREVTVRQVLDHAATQLADPRDARLASPMLKSRLQLTLGSSYLALGELDEAEEQLRESVNTRVREFGAEASQTINAKFNLAAVLYERGKHADAKALYRECLQVWMQSDDAPAERVLAAMNNLAQIAAHEGRLDEAERLQRETVEKMIAVLGPTHEHTLGAKVNLGAMLREQRKYEESERVLREAEGEWRAAFGGEHPGTLLAMHNLAILFLEAGRLEEAESAVRRLLELRTRVLGADHQDTIGAMTNLALILSRRGSPEAEKVYVDTWQGAQRVLGEEHPTTLAVGMNLLALYEGKGWPPASAPVVEKVVGTVKRIGEKPGASASELNSCAWLLLTAEPQTARDSAAALKAATRACDLERRTGGRELWQYLDTLALAYSQTGSVQNAVEAQREAIKVMPETPDAQQYLEEMKERLAEYERAASGKE